MATGAGFVVKFTRQCITEILDVAPEVRGSIAPILAWLDGKKQVALGIEIAQLIQHNHAVQIAVLPDKTAPELLARIEYAGSRIDKTSISKIPRRRLRMGSGYSSDKQCGAQQVLFHGFLIFLQSVKKRFRETYPSHLTACRHVNFIIIKYKYDNYSDQGRHEKAGARLLKWRAIMATYCGTTP